MNTKEQQLISLIESNKPKLRKWFKDFDSQSDSINDWQKYLGYPLEPHSCQICHRIRNNIMAGINYYFGEHHLGKKPYKEIANIHFKDAITYIKDGAKIREEITPTYAKISKLLYND